MTSVLRPYPTYKPSGVEWLGDVPAHWEMRKLRNVLSSSIERNRPDLPLLSVVREQGVILRDVTNRDENHNFVPDDLSNYKVVREDQFAINKMKSWQGSYGVSPQDGIVSPAYFVFDVHNMESDFFNRAIRSKAYVPFFGQASDGVRIGQWDLSPSRMREIPFPVPPANEQSTIVRYLDHADSRIQSYISAKERLIELLIEQKQAIINQAVTRGLDPNAPLKPSGVDWLGEVPAHWEVMPIKRAFTSMDYGISESSSDSGSIRLLTMGNISGGRVSVPHTGGVDSVAESLQLQRGDLLFNRTNSQELVGKVGLYAGHKTPVTFASYLVRLRAREQHSPEYLNTVLNDVVILTIVRREAIPSLHQSNLNPTRYGRITVPLPPLSEQNAIMEYLDGVTADIDEKTARARRQIELMQEYRTRLIADVVTGKLDVRNAMDGSDQADVVTAGSQQFELDVGR